MKRFITIICIALLAAVLIVAGCKSKPTTAPAQTTPVVPTTPTTEPDSKNDLTGNSVADVAASNPSGALEIPITVKDMKFNPATIIVTKNLPIRFTVSADDRDYGFAIAEFHVKEKVAHGQTISVEFTPDKTGTFIIFSRQEWNNGKIGELGRLVVNMQ